MMEHIYSCRRCQRLLFFSVILLIFAVITRAQPTVDVNGIVVPYASPVSSNKLAMSKIMGLQIPNGSNPWPFGDIAEFGCNTTPNCVPTKHGITTSILNAALANPPTLGTAITGSGTCTYTATNQTLVCTGSQFLTEAPGHDNLLTGNITCSAATPSVCTLNSGSNFVSGMVGNILFTSLGVNLVVASVDSTTQVTLTTNVVPAPLTTVYNYQGSCLVVATNDVNGTGQGRYNEMVQAATDNTHLSFRQDLSGTINFAGTNLNVYHCPIAVSSTFWRNWWNITQLGGGINWNYYDVVLAAYRANIRTAAQDVVGTYQTQARQLADYWWSWAFNSGGGGPSPRVAALAGLYLRALDGKPQYFTGLYNTVIGYAQANVFNPNNYDPTVVHDTRETGYVQGFLALGAIADTTANGGLDSEHTGYCNQLITNTPGWLKTVAQGGFLAPHGNWEELVYLWNQNFPYQGTGNSPWRSHIHIRALQMTYEVLNDTNPLTGCNNPTLASQILPAIQGALDWAYNYGVSKVALGGNGYPYYDVDFESNGIGPPTYSTHGTVALTLNSNIAVGTGTSFTTDFHVNDYFAPADYGVTLHFMSIYKITTITDNTHMTLNHNYGFYGETANAPSVATYQDVPPSESCASLATFCNQDLAQGPDTPPNGNPDLVRDFPGAHYWMSHYCTPQPTCRTSYIARGDELMARFLRGRGDGPYGTSTTCIGPSGLCYYTANPDSWTASLDGGSCGSPCGDGPFAVGDGQALGKGYGQGSGWNCAQCGLAFRLLPSPTQSQTGGKLITTGLIFIR